MKHTLVAPFIGLLTLLAPSLHAADPIDVGSRRELFVDRHLIDSMDGARLVLHHPQPREVVLKFDRPWEGLYSGYETVLKDGGTYRFYYRGMPEAIRVDAIHHSGKLRAQQTAEIFSEHLDAQAVPATGLAPNDDVAEIAKSIESEPGGIMLVGHLPFLERLAALLIAGNAESSVVTLDAGCTGPATFAHRNFPQPNCRFPAERTANEMMTR